MKFCIPECWKKQEIGWIYHHIHQTCVRVTFPIPTSKIPAPWNRGERVKALIKCSMTRKNCSICVLHLMETLLKTL